MGALTNATNAKRRWRDHLFFLLLCCSISILWGGAFGYSSSGLVDFRAVYYDARCLIEHHDPYNSNELGRVYRAEDGTFPSDPVRLSIFRRGSLVCFNLPSALFLIVPFALMGWGPAHLLWMALIAGLFTLAAVLMWSQARGRAPNLSLTLVCILAANTELLYFLGNTAGIVVSLSVVAVWCLLNERFVPAGIVCMALALAMKPHDAGLVWLYFVVAGGRYRKRAFQILLITCVLALPGFLWVSHVAPHWAAELRSNVAAGSAPGGINAPGPSAGAGRDADMVIDLQAAVSAIWKSPRIYNPVSYTICGILLLVWLVRTYKLRGARANPWLGLAAVVAPSLLVTYHRCYDAKLLLLTIPACAVLWSRRGITGWLALVFSSAAIVATADVPLNIFVMLTKSLVTGTPGIWGKILAVMFVDPTPLVLLAMGVFYLWVYVKGDAVPDPLMRLEEANQMAPADKPACHAPPPVPVRGEGVSC